MKQKKRFVRGVTLVEIAIVLVVIGLLLGGILKGQELINNARIRAVTDKQAGLKVAWYAFLDRYRGMPGDLHNAQRFIPGAGANRTGSGDGTDSGDGFIHERESAIVFQHLAGAGLLRCQNCTEPDLVADADALTAVNSPVNDYGGVMAIFMDSTYYGTQGAARATRLVSQMGPGLPSNIIRDVDLKSDDGLPFNGDLVASLFKGGSPQAVAAAGCLSKEDGADSTETDYIGAPITEVWLAATKTPIDNCSAAVIL